MPIIRGLAVSFILVLGNVDLSLGYIVGFVSVTQGMLLDAGVAPALTILIGLAIGAAFGLVNGVLVATMRVPSEAAISFMAWRSSSATACSTATWTRHIAPLALPGCLATS